MNKLSKSLLGVLIAVVSIFVIFKLFLSATLNYFGVLTEEAVKIIDYIAIYVPILIIIVTAISLAVYALNRSNNNDEK